MTTARFSRYCRRWRAVTAGALTLSALTVPALALPALALALTPGVAAADAAPSITSPASTSFTVGRAGTFTVTTAGDLPMTVTDAAATLPAGVTFADNGDGTATLAGMPAGGTGGNYPITITASNGVDPDATQSFLLTVEEPPAITSANQATFTAGGTGSFSITTTGTPAPAITEDGSLPGGITLTDNHDGTATLAGVPGIDGAGSYPVTITASNGVDPDATQTLAVVVLAHPTVSLFASPFPPSGPVTYGVAAGGPLGVATGSVTVADGQGGQCTAPLDAGQGSCSIAEDATSTPYAVTAYYAGDDHYAGSQTSASVVASVAAAGSAQTEADGITASASNGRDGVDTLTESYYATDPVAPVSGGGPYFAVAVSSGAQFSSLLISDCNDVNGSTLLLWWNPGAGAWQPVAGDPGPRLGSKSSGCLSVALDGSTSSPTLTQLATAAFTTVTYSGPAKGPTFTGKSSSSCQALKPCAVLIETRGTPASSLSEKGILPSGVSFADQGNGRAELSGPAGAGTQGRYPLTLTAANGAGTVRRSFVLTVRPASSRGR